MYASVISNIFGLREYSSKTVVKLHTNFTFYLCNIYICVLVNIYLLGTLKSSKYLFNKFNYSHPPQETGPDHGRMRRNQWAERISLLLFHATVSFSGARANASSPPESTNHGTYIYDDEINLKSILTYPNGLLMQE